MRFLISFAFVLFLALPISAKPGDKMPTTPAPKAVASAPVQTRTVQRVRLRERVRGIFNRGGRLRGGRGG